MKYVLLNIYQNTYAHVDILRHIKINRQYILFFIFTRNNRPIIIVINCYWNLSKLSLLEMQGNLLHIKVYLNLVIFFIIFKYQLFAILLADYLRDIECRDYTWYTPVDSHILLQCYQQGIFLASDRGEEEVEHLPNVGKIS